MASITVVLSLGGAMRIEVNSTDAGEVVSIVKKLIDELEAKALKSPEGGK